MYFYGVVVSPLRFFLLNYMAVEELTLTLAALDFILFFTEETQYHTRLKRGKDVSARNLALLMWIKKPPKFTH